jgi:transposase
MTNGNVSNTCSPVAPTQLGSRKTDNRLFVEAVLYRFRAGIPSRDLPERFGDFRVIHTPFSRWSKTGVWERVFQALCCEADNEYAAIDATMVRAHQHSAGAKASCAEDEGIGRSRGGLSTKIPAVVDALGSPISFFDGRSDQLTCGSLGVTAAAVEAEAVLARSKLTMLRRE